MRRFGKVAALLGVALALAGSTGAAQAAVIFNTGGVTAADGSGLTTAYSGMSVVTFNDGPAPASTGSSSPA
jgi:hypothetical protein